MSEVIKFYGRDAAKNPDAVLEQAVGNYDNVLVLGWDKEGHLDPRADLGMDKKEILLMVEVFKFNLILGNYDE